MDLSPVVIAIPIYFLLIFVELAIQFFSGRKIYRFNDAVSNISCGIVQQLSGLFFRVLSIGAYVLLFEKFRFFTIEANVLTGIILFISVDFFYYWAHRFSHEINLFWGGHVVHHQSEDYNFSVALRQSSFQIIWTFAFYLPLAFLGFDPAQFVFVSALVTVYQFWIHTETIGKLGPLEWIFNTPSHHRVHHGRDPKYIDRNHAGVFIIWDKMFGTFQREEERPTYGITRPLRSWNPVWANLDHYAWIWKNLWSIRGVKNKMRFLLAKPGWFPEDMGGYQAPPPVDKEKLKKFDTVIPVFLSIYVLMQFISILILTALLLFRMNDFNLVEMLIPASYLVFSCLTLGLLLERPARAWMLEFGRLLIPPVAYACAVFTGLTLPSVNIFIWTSLWGLISVFLFLWIYASRIRHYGPGKTV